VPEKKKYLGCSLPVFIIVSIILITLLIIGASGGAFGSEKWFTVSVPAIHLPTDTIFHIGSFAVTNTILSAWVSMVVLVGLSWAVTRRIKLIPSRLQTLIEFAIEWMYNFCVEVAGEENGRRFFPIVTTIFLFVLINAWMNLIPGYGTILYTAEAEQHHEETVIVEEATGHDEADHHEDTVATGETEDSHSDTAADNGEKDTHEEAHSVHLLRGANTDINFPLALAVVAFVFIWYHGTRALGLRYFKKFLNVGQFFGGFGKLFTGKVKAGFAGIGMGFIDIFVSVLEFLSEFIRVVSFTFRLFGNMLGGEILILMMMFLVPWFLAIPFYGLELFVGLIQAVVFAGLTLVFASTATIPHGGEEH